MMNAFVKIIIGSFFLFSCNKSSVITNRKASEILINDDGLALYSSYDTLVNVENILTNEKIFKLKVESQQILIPTALLKKYNYVFFPLNDSTLSCRDFKTKSEVWNFNCKEVISSLTNANDSIILVGIRNKGIIALDMITGKKLYEIEDSNLSTCNSSFTYSIVSAENFFFVSDFNCNTVTAYNLKLGKEVWKYKSKISGITRMLLMEKFVFCGITGNPTNKEGAILLLDKNSGQLIFEKNEQFDLITKPVLYENNVVYLTYDSKLKEFNSNDKTVNVINEFNKDDFNCGNQFFLKDDSIYFTDCKFNLYRFDLKSHNKIVLDKLKSNLLGVYKNGSKIKFIY